MRILDTDTHVIEVPDGATVGPAPIRNITTRAFMQRIPLASRVAIRNSTDEVIVDLQEDLRLASFVDLDHPQTAAGLSYIVSQGIMTQSEADACLVDGTEGEAP
jgi:hypothetical protein